MPQSLAKVLVHLIFSTKHRAPTIERALRPALHAYIDGILQHLQCVPLQTGGTVDHVHALLVLARTMGVADVAEKVKAASSKWMKQHGVRDFAWQAGYAAFSVGKSQARQVIHYIGRQEEHHRRLTFQDEFRRFLDCYGIDYDERYLWD